MTTDRPDLSHLSDLATSTHRDPIPVTEIQWRARAIKRRRRGATVTCAAILGIALVATPSLWPNNQAPFVQEGIASSNECPNQGSTVAAPPSAAPGQLEIAADPSPDLPLHYYFVRKNSPICPLATPLGLGISLADDGRVLGGMTVWHNVEDPTLEPQPGRDPASLSITDVTVRGLAGKLVQSFRHRQPASSDSFRLSWRDAKGVPWLVEASGTSTSELVAAVDALRFTGDEATPRLDAASLPKGMTSVPMPHRPAPHGYWTVAGYQKDDESYRGVALFTEPVRMPVEYRASISSHDGKRFVTRDGQRFLIEDTREGDMHVTELYWLQDDNELRLSSQYDALSTEELLTMAATVRLTTPSDPRVVTDHTTPESRSPAAS